MPTPRKIPQRMHVARRMNAPQHGSMFPHTVTVYSAVVEYDENFNGTLTNHITILRGVLLDASKGANVRSSGLVGADAVTLYIPRDVVAVDGVTGKPQKYTPPVEFWKMEDHSEAWTISAETGENEPTSRSTFFIKGEVVEPDRDRGFLESAYDDVYSVTKVDNKDFGGLAHLEVGGV